MNATTRRRAAARVALAHLDPRPLTGDRLVRRLQDVATAHGLPRWRADTGADPDGHTWAAVSWRSPRGELTVRVPWSRHAPRDISARVARILELEAAGRLRPARRTPTIRPDHEEPDMTRPMRYRKKPVTIEAMRLTGTAADCHAVMSWMEANRYPFLVGNALEPETLRYRDQAANDDSTPDKGIWINPANGDLMVRTPGEGNLRARAGDWIVHDMQGKFYPCAPYTFESIYEEVTP